MVCHYTLIDVQRILQLTLCLRAMGVIQLKKQLNYLKRKLVSMTPQQQLEALLKTQQEQTVMITALQEQIKKEEGYIY